LASNESTGYIEQIYRSAGFDPRRCFVYPIAKHLIGIDTEGRSPELTIMPALAGAANTNQSWSLTTGVSRGKGSAACGGIKRQILANQS
jgi:hypothetical protein